MELRLIQANESDAEIIDAIGRLRVQVWRGEETIALHEFGDADVWTDALDHEAYHWVVYQGDELVASARLSIHSSMADIPYAHVFRASGVIAPGKVASINRLIVAKPYRGLGIARALDRARLAKAAELGAQTVLAMPVGEARRLALTSLGYVPLAIDLDPLQFGLSLENARVSVMMAPLVAARQPAPPEASDLRWDSTKQAQHS